MSIYPLVFAIHVYDSLSQTPISLLDAQKMTEAEMSEWWANHHKRGEYITYLSHKNPTGTALGFVEFVNGLAGGHNS